MRERSGGGVRKGESENWDTDADRDWEREIERREGGRGRQINRGRDGEKSVGERGKRK